ncbi:tetratricopeptide repeat protein [Pelagibacteraceae bacterium]|nr:tetratricopeptide repeat protein [Pelagibacteraceae bacterium]
MKFLIKKIYIILVLFTLFLPKPEASANQSKSEHTKKNISNYFLGIIATNQNYNEQAFKHLSKIQLLKSTHSQFNTEFIKVLVLLEKYDQAFTFSKSVWNENEYFFAADLLLGLDLFIKGDYLNAEKYFKRLNNPYQPDVFFEDFIGNILVAWTKAALGNKEGGFKTLEKIPSPYNHLTKTQNVLMKCYFDNDNTQKSFLNLINDKDYNFSRYNFFLINYLLFKNKKVEAKKLIIDSREKNSSNLLLEQTEIFFLEKDYKKIKDFFDCKNPKDSLAEFFYIMANLFASEKNYQLSNFYLKISIFLNDKFLSNKALLAENFYYQGKNKLSKNVYNSIKSIGRAYSWYSSKSIATILVNEKGKKYSLKKLKKDFNSISNPNYKKYYELANFYKDQEYYKESIKYYSLALKKIKKNHFLIPKILDRRGTSYEQLGDWDSAEKDLIESLKILPDQPHVLNYLAYTWVDKGINLDKSLEMLIKASQLRQNDGYIIDSLGWAYYAKRNYVEAEKLLKRAVELMPTDPVINDHYGDTLWMLNKTIQARYFWNSILKIDSTKQELKDNINKKLIFGTSINY